MAMPRFLALPAEMAANSTVYVLSKGVFGPKNMPNSATSTS
jgi:hypothetical protein